MRISGIKFIRPVFSLFFIFFASAARLQAQSSAVIHRLDGSTIRTAEAEAFAKATLQKESVTGAQIAVVERGRLVWSMAFGLRGRNPDLPTDRQTTKWAASISKGIFATYVMQLVERSEFELDVPIAKHFRSRSIIMTRT